MTFLKKNLYRVFFATSALAMPIVSFAADTTTTTTGSVGAPVKFDNPIGVNSLPEFIKKFLEGAIKVGIPVIALAIVYCGFLFVSARGNPEKLTKAKEALLYTCLGAAILLGSWAIATLISATVTGLG